MRMSIGEHRVLRAGEYDTLRQAMAFPSLFPILLIFSLVGSGFAEEEASPQGCGSFLCNLDAAWGVAVAVGAGIAALASLILALVLLCRLRHITEPEARSGVAPLLLLLATVFMLCAVSFAYVIERNDSVCIARHSLWGAQLVLTIAYQATQGVRLLRCPCFRALAGVAIGSAVVLGLAILEWILAIALHPGRPVCQYGPLRISLVFLYMLLLVLIIPITLSCGLTRGQPEWRYRIVSLFVMCYISAVVWTTDLAYHVHKESLPVQSPNREDEILAKVLVSQAWLLLLLHIAPEAQACLRPAPQPSGPHDVPEQAQPRPRGASLEEGIPLSPQPTVESQGSASYSSSDGSGSQWPSTSFHIETSSNAEPMPSTSTGMSHIWHTETSRF
ncbi:G-protein coupled receptor family C group 5 member B-like [Brienomyrus brachyistius]|uniref:G-protein coupled receptor family C group 5 member B-like n=1 Tax=Brienomyrus brachyistius TaxID=42636 RepID=UPI0020B1C5AC|nr:G-protein coupled receptor family C group 5 member B-like [Brienomyrus brachyistius]XP_048865784.1 G-protein coupled receptor family C group 5 member B-like [Brienomyrus brachyistius]